MVRVQLLIGGHMSSRWTKFWEIPPRISRGVFSICLLWWWWNSSKRDPRLLSDDIQVLVSRHPVVWAVEGGSQSQRPLGPGGWHWPGGGESGPSTSLHLNGWGHTVAVVPRVGPVMPTYKGQWQIQTSVEFSVFHPLWRSTHAGGKNAVSHLPPLFPAWECVLVRPRVRCDPALLAHVDVSRSLHGTLAQTFNCAASSPSQHGGVGVVFWPKDSLSLLSCFVHGCYCNFQCYLFQAQQMVLYSISTSRLCCPESSVLGEEGWALTALGCRGHLFPLSFYLFIWSWNSSKTCHRF